MNSVKPTVAIVVAQFNAAITSTMLDAAQEEAMKLELGTTVVRVPGSYEIPLIAKKLLQKPAISAIVALGYIEKGETLHGEVLGHVISRALIEASLEFGKPVGLGIIGPGATLEQAHVRKEGAARAAVNAIAASLKALAEIDGL